MDNQKLNRRLAEWAGFTSAYPDEVWSMWVLWGKPDPVTLIRKKIASGTLSKGLNFTQSLDVCFMWLVPMAIEEIMAEYGCSSDVAYAILFTKWLQELDLIIPEAALALCLAIEKLSVRK